MLQWTHEKAVYSTEKPKKHPGFTFENNLDFKKHFKFNIAANKIKSISGMVTVMHLTLQR